MRKALMASVICMCLMLCGCDLWMDGSYHSVEPNRSKQAVSTDTSVEVSSYVQIRDALFEMVDNGITKRVLYMYDIGPSLFENYMQIAVNHVMSNYPLGAYAVEGIDYDIGTNTAKPAVSVEIAYVHGRAEILRIKKAATMKPALEYIYRALSQCESGVVIAVESYEETDFEQLVHDYVDSNPQLCMEMPQVTVSVYPQTGEKRILELGFTYQTSREVLRSMQETVKPIFESAELYISGDIADRTKLALLYSFLMERFDYKNETSITPSYSLLHHGVGDSKAFATVYGAMCRQAGLDCRVVSGTKDGVPRYWNVYFDGTEYYYLDLMESHRVGSFRIRSAQEMSGYVWDYSAYEPQ